jgi:hypothetical protein
MKCGSIGEIPPRTRGSVGLTLRTACAASVVISENAFHSGSSSKSQWDMLFGSFQSITASTAIYASPNVGRSPRRQR